MAVQDIWIWVSEHPYRFEVKEEDSPPFSHPQFHPGLPHTYGSLYQHNHHHWVNYERFLGRENPPALNKTAGQDTSSFIQLLPSASGNTSITLGELSSPCCLPNVEVKSSSSPKMESRPPGARSSVNSLLPLEKGQRKPAHFGGGRSPNTAPEMLRDIRASCVC